GAVAHQPDHQLPLRLDARINRGVLGVLRLAVFLEDEVDLRMRLRPRIDLARAGGELVTLGIGILEDERRVGGEGDLRNGERGDDEDDWPHAASFTTESRRHGDVIGESEALVSRFFNTKTRSTRKGTK